MSELTQNKKACHCEERSDVAISFKVRCLRRNIVRFGTLYQRILIEIATSGLKTLLAMTR